MARGVLDREQEEQGRAATMVGEGRKGQDRTGYGKGRVGQGDT